MTENKSPAPKKAPAKASPAAKAPKAPKPTAEERKTARLAAAAEAARQAEARQAAFEADRPRLFLELFAKAMRVQLIVANYPEVAETHSWWFEYFRVDARKCSFSTEDGGSAVQTVERLHPALVERLHAGLDSALGWFDEYDAEQARKREEARILEEKRAKARAKLTDEEARVLGIR